jgi:hypothetical protein
LQDQYAELDRVIAGLDAAEKEQRAIMETFMLDQRRRAAPLALQGPEHRASKTTSKRRVKFKLDATR